MTQDEKAKEILDKFARKMVESQVSVDPDIQQILNEHIDEILFEDD